MKSNTLLIPTQNEKSFMRTSLATRSLFAVWAIQAWGWMSLSCTTTLAQPPVSDAVQTATPAAPSSPNQPDESKKPPKEIVAIVGGDIITVTRGTIRKGTILIEDGKITSVANDVDIPANAKKIDATGKVVTPGFTAISMSGVGLSGGGGPPIGAGPPASRNAGRLVDELNPYDRNIKLLLAAGVTSGCIQVRAPGGRRGRRAPEEGFELTERFPGFDPDEKELEGTLPDDVRFYGQAVQLCPCCSLPILPTEPITSPPPAEIAPQMSSVIKMSYGSLSGMFLKEVAFLELTPGALTGAGNQAAWREQIANAKKYLADQAKHEQAIREGRREQPPRKPVSDEILSLVKRDIALRLPANRVSEILEQVELSKELNYRLVIKGGLEGWVIPQEIAEAGAALTITPRNRREARFGEEKSSGSWIELPRVLEESGIPFAVEALEDAVSLGGIAGRDLTSLPLEAAFAVRGGASESRALAAITIVPATLLGLQDRIGSIEVGKDADLLILNGQPLDYRTYVETALVNGRVAYVRSEDRIVPVYERNK